MSTVLCMNAVGWGSGNAVAKMLKGSVTAGQNVVNVAYNSHRGGDANLIDGAAKFDTMLHATPGPKIGLGYDLGAAVLTYWLANYGPTSDIPAGDLAFVLLGNPARKYGGYLNSSSYQPGLDFVFGVWKASPVECPANTPYTVLDLAREYDGLADYPDVSSDPYYKLSADNARWGYRKLHKTGYNSILASDLDNTGFYEGNVTYMLAPTMPLPIMSVMYQYLWVSKERSDRAIRPKVDVAYSWVRTAALYTPMVTAPFPELGTVACAEPDHFFVQDGKLTPQPWMQHRLVSSASSSSASYRYPPVKGMAKKYAIDDGVLKEDTVARAVAQWTNLSPIPHWVYGIITRGGVRVTLTARSRGYLQVLSGIARGDDLPELTESSRVGCGADMYATVYCVAEIRQNSRSFPLAPELTGWLWLDSGDSVTAEVEVKFISEFWETQAISGGTVETESGFQVGETKIDLFGIPVIDAAASVTGSYGGSGGTGAPATFPYNLPFTFGE